MKFWAGFNPRPGAAVRCGRWSFATRLAFDLRTCSRKLGALFPRNLGNSDRVALHVACDLYHLSRPLLKIGKRLIVNLIHRAAADENILASTLDARQGAVAIRLAMLARHLAVTCAARAI